VRMWKAMKNASSGLLKLKLCLPPAAAALLAIKQTLAHGSADAYKKMLAEQSSGEPLPGADVGPGSSSPTVQGIRQKPLGTQFHKRTAKTKRGEECVP
jgi:hypothetical protein